MKALIAKRPRKDGCSAISFQYCYSSANRVTLDCEIAIPSLYWNKKRQQISKNLPIEFGNADRLNAELLRQKKVIEALIDKGIGLELPNVGAYVKQVFTAQLKIAEIPSAAPIQVVKSDLGFFGHLNGYIAFKEKNVVSPGPIRSMRERLLAYQDYLGKKITFSMLDYDFYLDLVDFLTNTYVQKRKKELIIGLKVNTIGKTIKNLRGFVKDRVRRKLIAPISLDDFKAFEEETDAVYLNYEEISRLYYLDLTIQPSLAESRDMLVFGCLTGLRYSDFSNLSYTDMRGDMLYKKTDKKDNWVVVPLTVEAKELFIRLYKDRKPTTSNPVFNRQIKVIAELAGLLEPITFSFKKGLKDVTETKAKCLWVTSHTCRRSFCTNEFMASTDVHLIMRISGHKSLRDFFKYIRCSEQHAALKIQEIWKQRNNLTVLSLPKSA
ncbi:MAG TPA: tyrosine-type recombinase/integrase [Flavipsychrobacter sp.]|nr:tyrosine-type recombinase/integrase [Flavipsychrobacter sp.]